MRWTTLFVMAGSASAVMLITHYRGKPVPRADRIATFRRILTVTNLMCLAGNKPGEPKRRQIKSS